MLRYVRVKHHIDTLLVIKPFFLDQLFPFGGNVSIRHSYLVSPVCRPCQAENELD